ncbi:Uncharacterised protein [Phocoenobacter uteri]|uniref:Uncharacterized protein n=1 Tax=Phocoenobacter uteri TaxID=146806 RepID=A0A379C7P7_9PAST|nr:hypothetical protein [Phocoenobacter uteri]MDG6882019.1 hypothetical protein [Phocoenobacter uteri]SUB58168.1 Uncharacterised protein [Phocoenobacter uteri]
MKPSISKLSLITLPFILTACGSGGGSSSKASNTQPKAENIQKAPQMNNESKKVEKQPNGKGMPKEKESPKVNGKAEKLQRQDQGKEEQLQGNVPEDNLNATPSSFGLDAHEDKQKLTFKIYEGTGSEYSDAELTSKNITVNLKDKSTKIDEEKGYYFSPLGNFENGYVGYYLQSSDNKTLQARLFYNVKKELIKPQEQLGELSGKFDTTDGFIVNTTKQNQNIVKRLEATITFSKGNADGYVLDDTRSEAIKITGDATNLIFDVQKNNLGISVGDKQASTPIFVKESKDSQDVSRMIGKIQGDSYNAVYVLDKAEK